MARMPGAVWQGEHGGREMARYDIVCLHTIVGYAPAHAAHFSTNAAGKIFQSRDTRFRSAANLEGNYRVIAVENEDHGPAFGQWNTGDGHAVPAFTAAQVETIARICAWAHETHGIPLVACPDSKPGSRGIGYHRQGVDGNWDGYTYGGRVAGGEVWTNFRGKVCPGDRRIAQIPRIIARAKQLAGETEEDVMTPEQEKKLDLALARLATLDTRQRKIEKGPGGVPDTEGIFYQVDQVEEMVVQAQAEILARLDQIAAGNVDYAALAVAVADELHRRTEA